MIKKPLLLVILDGFGLRDQKKGNAIKLAQTPNFNDLFKNYPWTSLKAAGQAVGLPVEQMGNSEVGHLNIGAGQVVYTGLSLINNAIEDKTFFTNKSFLTSINHSKTNHSTLHLMGLLSPGGVHSLQEHLFLLLDLAYQKQVKNLTVHIFTDGRDVSPRSVKPWLEKLIIKLKQYNYQLGSICGRLYAMDRDKKFNKTIQAYDAICGKSNHYFHDPLTYVNQQYAKNLNDEFFEPAINDDKNVRFLKDNDSVIFFNFRPDRARQLTHLIVGSKLYDYQLPQQLKNIQLTTMMKYEGITNVDVAFDSMHLDNTLGSVLAKNHLSQLRIAETQKYAHVTFFFDGGNDIKYDGSQRILIPSPKIDNFAHKPEMAAKEITDALLTNMQKYDVVIVNYANPDMVGHTGDLNATIKAIQVIDHEIGRLKTYIAQIGGVMFITADHGNAEIMLDKNNQPATKHTTSDVPFICTDQTIKFKDGGKLANITPTILDYLKITKPQSMDQNSLILNYKKS